MKTVINKKRYKEKHRKVKSKKENLEKNILNQCCFVKERKKNKNNQNKARKKIERKTIKKKV